MKRNDALKKKKIDFSTKKSIIKKTITLTAIVLFCYHAGFAQRSKNTENAPPLFNPVTNCQLRYYYFPNLEAYFDTKKNIYYYKENGEWITAEEIPDGYRGYSFYNKITVYITDYDDDYPYKFIETHKKKYPYINNERVKKMVLSED